MDEPWDFPSPHVIAVDVDATDIDEYGHVNNAVYLRWLDRAAWSHSAALGVSVEGVEIATWIAESDHKLRVTRRFHLRHATDGGTLARATTQYVCLNLDSGRAIRMPPEFKAAYRVTP
jgi:acyl-CoA thioester hydrolase